MELNRYLDLYLSESQDHLRMLNRALLALEAGETSAAIEEAFRAAHTLKGMSATMGFTGVSEIAHDLENLLDEVRSGRRHVDGELVDQMLGGGDVLERAIAAAAAGEPLPQWHPFPGASAAVAEGQAGPVASVSASAAAPKPLTIAGLLSGTPYVRVSLKAEEPMKIARALIMTRMLVQKGLAERSEPEQFADDFDGEFALVLKPQTDETAVAAILGALPEVAQYSFEKSTKPKPAEKPKAGSAAKAAVAPAPKKPSFLRVDQRRMDEIAEGLAEMAILQGRVEQLVSGQTGQLADDLVPRISRLISDLRYSVLAMRMVPVGDVFDRFPRMIRDAARALGKDVDFQIEGREIEIDRSILEEIADPLVHLLRNAVDHGIETPAERYGAGKDAKATLILRAMRDRSSVRIQVAEDGRGVNAKKVLAKARAKGIPTPETSDVTSEELLRILALPGFSTAEQVTDVSGRGVGLDAVISKIRALGGAIDMQTQFGEGTTMTLRLPITLAIAQALRVRVGDEDYAIPLTHVAEAVELEAVRIDRHKGKEVLRLRDEVLPLVRLRSVLGAAMAGSETAAVVAELGERRTALAVDELVGREQILVKQFDGAVGTLPIFSGVTLLADGRPALVLDPISVV